jgi:hypothetical protein
MREGCREGGGRLRYQHPAIKRYQNTIIGMGRKKKCKEVRTAFTPVLPYCHLHTAGNWVMGTVGILWEHCMEIRPVPPCSRIAGVVCDEL